MAMSVHIIIVTHNSQKEIALCIEALQKQTALPDSVVVVDSGSSDPAYLDYYKDRVTTLIKTENIGFSRANNLGYQSLEADSDDIVIFLNPDAFLTPHVVSKVLSIFQEQRDLGCLTGKLIGYDIENLLPTRSIDSTGIFRRWYGRWFDRGQGETDLGQYDRVQDVPAACGAFMCCRNEVLRLFGSTVFDESFFMYKEDIELSLRIKKQNYSLRYFPQIEVFHCRGWSTDRKTMSYMSRLESARNEVKMYVKHPSPYMLWALMKYIAVRFARL